MYLKSVHEAATPLGGCQSFHAAVASLCLGCPTSPVRDLPACCSPVLGGERLWKGSVPITVPQPLPSWVNLLRSAEDLPPRAGGTKCTAMLVARVLRALQGWCEAAANYQGKTPLVF